MSSSLVKPTRCLTHAALPDPADQGKGDAPRVQPSAGSPDEGRVHTHRDTQSAFDSPGIDQQQPDPQSWGVDASGGGDGGVHDWCDAQILSDPAIATLVLACRERRFRLRLRNSLTNQLYAWARSCLGFSTLDEDKARREEQATLARGLVDALLAGRAGPVSVDPAVADAVRSSVLMAEPALARIDEAERSARRLIERTAATLPVWAAWGEGVRGFGAFGLGLIVGECGDVGSYATVSRLWKRMGLAVIDGRAQGKPAKGASDEEWIEHGYNPQRRSVMWTIGDALIKGNSEPPAAEGGEREPLEYRRLYLERKALELGRVATPMHAHRRAQRVMEKRLLRDLWAAWRKAVRS